MMYEMKWKGVIELKSTELEAALAEMHKILDKALPNRQGTLSLGFVRPKLKKGQIQTWQEPKKARARRKR